MKNTIKTFKPFNFKPKPFLKINEQINLLATRGLNIVNRNRLIKYIKNYNYQNFVNGYNDLLFINEDRKFNKYKNDVNSNDLIEIFNFDRWIGFMILSNILNIERMISSYITTVICEYMSKYDEYSFILNWDLDTYKYIFKEYFDDNSNNTKSETKKFDDIKKIIKGEFIKKKSYSLLVNKYKNCENDIPLWTLSIYWTFGAINKLFKYLNQELSNKVLENISFNISKKRIIHYFRII